MSEKPIRRKRRERKKKEEEEEGAERRRRRRKSMLRSLTKISLTDEDKQIDERTKFLYTSQEKTSLRSILMIMMIMIIIIILSLYFGISG